MQNFKAIGPLKWVLRANAISQDFSWRWIVEDIYCNNPAESHFAIIPPHDCVDYVWCVGAASDVFHPWSRHMAGRQFGECVSDLPREFWFCFTNGLWAHNTDCEKCVAPAWKIMIKLSSSFAHVNDSWTVVTCAKLLYGCTMQGHD